MLISILTLFPEMFSNVFSSSIIGRAKKNKIIDIRLINIRDFTKDKHKSVDDKPYGGGAGMLMRVDIIEKAIEVVKKGGQKEKVVLLDPKGKFFTQKIAKKYSKLDHLILICGHYEGIDARVSNFVDETISVGQFILTGGEIPAMLIVDCVSRLIPYVLGNQKSVNEESFSKYLSLLEAPQYTRPPVYKGLKVPKVLLSGNHQEISNWKIKKSKKI